MTRDAEDPVKTVHVKLDCRECDQHIETSIRLPTAQVHAGTVRVRCSECGRPTPYRKEDRSGFDPDWFYSLEESGQVYRFARGVDDD
jgi:ribosomal protein L44E